MTTLSSKTPHALPKGYRVVRNGIGQYWVQRRNFLFIWRDWKYCHGWNGWETEFWCPKFSSKEEACRTARDILDVQRKVFEDKKARRTITVVGPC